jgi:hypothetical protein
MRCLNDSEIQAVADNEAASDVEEHARTCSRCHQRVRERAALIASIAKLGDNIAVPPQVTRRVEQTLSDGSRRGATRLRDDGSGRPGSRRRAFWSAIAVAAATVLVILVVAPLIKGPSTVSAAEILAESASRLARPDTNGVEFLEYELTVDGVPRGFMPDEANGTYRVKQVIDRAVAGHYRLATYGPDGQLVSALAQDPASGRRIMSLRVEGQPYRFEFRLDDTTSLSVPEMERLHMEASVAMMQASGNQHLQVIETGAGRQYRIDVPRVSARTPGMVWDLTEAQVLIDANDYSIVQFAVKGSFLKQPYSVSYQLITREMRRQAEVPADAFDVADEPGAIRFEGEGTAIPARDALMVALRELAKVKQGRK